ncbi:MAG: glycosyltransferase family 4 protein [Rhodoferax sp.]
MALRVLLLTQWFEPEPAFKGLSFAKELIKQGFEVEVVTGYPNYPTGRIYPGFKIKPAQHDLIDGVNITRVALYPSHDRSAIKRILNYASFACSSFLYCLFFVRNIDVIYAYHPPLTVGITASLLRLLKRIPVVYDIQDLWPDTLRTTGMLNNERVLSFVGKVCSQVYKRVDRIVVLSPGFKKQLIQRGVPEGKIEIIYNWSDESRLNVASGRLPSGFPSGEDFRLLFAGNMGAPQALGAVLEAARLLMVRAVRAKLIFVGTGLMVEDLKMKATVFELTNVLFYPPVSMSEISAYLNSADALLVHLKADELFEITIPSKTQAYMAVGKPILMAVEGDAAELVKMAGCGVMAKPEDPVAIAEAVESLARMSPGERQEMGDRGLAFYQENLSLAVGSDKFKKIFKNVVQNN